MTEIENAKSLFQTYDKNIDDLYTFRDKYYILNENVTNANDRNEALNKKLESLVQELEPLNDKFESRASYFVLIGKAYNVLPDYSQKACDYLTKAIKLDPKSMDAWNYLGECYWKKRDFEMCRNCFERSLNLSRTNKLALRGMSMVMRQLINVPTKLAKDQSSTTNGTQQSNSQILSNQTNQSNDTQTPQPMVKYDNIKNLMDESIKYAKESLQIDVKDGMSWYILANCYVAKFFSPFVQQNSGLLKQAISAYNLAVKNESVACFQSDLYFNKSMISMYEENWQDVLECLCKALQLDPFWVDAKENLRGTLDYLTQINDMIKLKGKLKAKKFQSLIETLKKKDESILGPYLDGYQVPAKNSTEKPQKIDLIESTLADLQKGLNSNKVLVGKVICGLPTKNAENFNIVCFSCCIADSNGDCAALTIYNLASGHGVIIGNSVAIPEPWLETIDFNFDLNGYFKNDLSCPDLEKQKKYEFNFKSIRVENPTVLVVNGKKWTKDKVSSAFFVPKVISD